MGVGRERCSNSRGCVGCSWVTLRKCPSSFLLSFLLHWDVKIQIFATLAKVQPARPALQMSSDFTNARGALEDTQGSCMMERRLQRKYEWTELHLASLGVQGAVFLF